MLCGSGGGISYDYSTNSWAWLDFTDAGALYKDAGRTELANVGDEILRVSNKSTNTTPWRCLHMKRGNIGITAVDINEYGHGVGGVVYGTRNMYTTNSDPATIEFATVLVVKDPNSTSGFFNGNTYVIYPNSWQHLLLFWSGSSTLYCRTMQTNNASRPISLDRHKCSTGYVMYSVTTKQTAAGFDTDIEVNGTKVAEFSEPIPDGLGGRALQPSINQSATRDIFSGEYIEHLWWDHVPEDWDKIKAALMQKYGITPLE